MFKAKKLLKGSGLGIFDLMTHRASLLKDVKRIVGNREGWTIDGNILTFDMEGKIFTVRSIEDIRKVRANCFQNYPFSCSLLTLFRLGEITLCPLQVFPCCAKTISSRLLKLSDF